MEPVGVTPTRRCRKCALTSTDMSLFVKDKGSRWGRRNYCQECYQANTKAHKDYSFWQTDHQVRKRYGIDAATYLERMASRNKCDVCGAKEELCYDHCHATMDFRGVLCRRCNRCIGQLGDTAEAVQKALDYLVAHEQRSRLVGHHAEIK
jgi:hypothetical protein